LRQGTTGATRHEIVAGGHHQRSLVPFAAALAATIVVSPAWAYPEDEGWPITWAAGAGSPLVVDMDGDGRLETVFGGWSTTDIGVFDSRGTMLPDWPVSFHDDIGCEIAGGDIDNDGQIEAVFGTDRLDQTNQLIALRIDASALPGWPIEIDRWLLTTFEEFPAVNEAPHGW